MLKTKINLVKVAISVLGVLMLLTCIIIFILILSSCYQRTFVLCTNGNLETCLEKQLPKDAHVVSIDSSSVERGVYLVKYRQ